MSANKPRKNLSLIIILCIIMNLFTVYTFADVPTVLSQAQPVIQLISYKITEGNVELDSGFKIEVTLKNNNSYATAYNVMSEVTTPDMNLHLKDGEVNQCYFSSIGPNETVTYTQSFYIEKGYENRSALLSYTFNYCGENGKEYTNTTSISPEVIIPCKLKINVLSVAKTASLGSRSLVNVRCTNDGTIDISSLTLTLSGNIAGTQSSIDLGSLKSGEQLMRDCYINFLKTGTQELNIIFEYKDDEGNTYTLPKQTYYVEVSSSNSAATVSSSNSGKGKIVIGGISISTKLFVFVTICVVIIIYAIIKLAKSIKKGNLK